MRRMNQMEYNEMMGDFFNEVQASLENYPEDALTPEELYAALGRRPRRVVRG
jgi:hypothetical protein